MTVGQRIKIKREEKGLSQKELANLIGYESKSAMSYVEADKRELPFDKLSEVAKVLGVSPNWLLGWTEEPVFIKTDLSVIVEELKTLDSDQLARVRKYIEFVKFEGGAR